MCCFREPGVNPHRQHLKEPKSLREEMQPRVVPLKSEVSRFEHMLREAQLCGEYEKLTLGWFENYPQTKFKHTHLEPVS